MVFESIVVDILNRLLGDYFKNLDTSQLKLGIWGGDVVLRELVLKHSAMDDLGLPFKVVVGKVGTLRMKIPWQNLYKAPVEINLQDLLLLVTPSYSVKYDEEAEEIGLQADKQREIARLDEVRARERLKKQGEDNKQQEDTFTEKLITQIIKNVQIRIDCIHIRYEDDVTKPQNPFGFGVILKSLHIETTDNDWMPAMISDVVETVNKMVTLEGLAAYWNSKTELIKKRGQTVEMIESLRELILNENNHLTHILAPISSVVKVLLTPNPERSAEPFSKPKFSVDVVMEELGLGMTNLQFQDIMELLEALEFMTRAQTYRKYRPTTVEHKGHYKDWWRFCYRCIVEEEVRRRRQNWDWLHMKRHRGLCRTYADAYYKKLTLKKLKSDTVQALHHCEKELDVFNITLVRKQVEVKIEREGKRHEISNQQSGWFSGWTSWMGGGGEKDNTIHSTESAIGDIAQKFEEALTPEEKSKLYDAIDYSENALPLDYPETYEEYYVNFCLNTLSFIVRDAMSREKKENKILNCKISRVETKMVTRPVKKGLKVDVLMGSLEAEGLKGKHDTVPVKIITSKMMSGQTHLLEVTFESNPLNSQANQRVKVQAQPIEVVYHGKTVVHLAKCFTLPPEMQLSKLQAAAMSTINDWREQSASGLQHLIETRGEIDIDIDLVAPYFLVPRDGNLNPMSSVLVVDLGELKIKSRPRNKQSGQEKVQSLGKALIQSDEEYIAAMQKVAYDTLIVELLEFQIFIALPGEDYTVALTKDKLTGETSMPQTLLKSKQLMLQLEQSLIPDDPRFARLQLEGNLPMLNLDLSEHRMMELVKLLVTLPFPQAEIPSSTSPPPTLNTISEDPTVAESYAISKITYGDSANEQKPKPMVEFIELLIKFTVDSIKIRVSRVHDLVSVPFVDFELKHLQAKMTSKTFSNTIDLAIGGLTLCALQNKIQNSDGPLYLLKTPMTLGIDKHLFKMHIFSILPGCPIKLSGKVKQLIKVDVTSLDVILHTEALKSFISFGDEIAQTLEVAQEATSRATIQNADSVSVASSSSVASSFKGGGRRLSKQFSRMEASRKAVAKKHTNANDILLQIDAKMESLTVQISSEKKNLMRAVLCHMDFSMVQKVGKTVMIIELVDLGVRNLDPNTIYKDVISVDSDKVVSVKVVMYEDATKGKMYYNMDKHDMSVKIETGSPKIFYISRQLDELLAFIDNFATAKAAVIDASTAAAMAAKVNVEQAYSAASRILLDINLNAPIIFIPRNEKSQQGLLADLGRLTLKNRFTKQQVRDFTSYAVVDKMDINLTNMKVSRIVFDKNTQNMQSEVLMLDPVNFKISITRNLSSDWYNGVPDFTLNGTLWSALIRASNEDYDVVMATLFENILYKPDTHPPVSPSISNSNPKNNQTKKKRDERVASKAQSGSSFQTVVSSRATIDSSTYTTMEINIDIPQMQVIMYQKGSVKLEECHGIVQRNEATAFADFAIRTVEMNMKSWSNGNMFCPITVGEINLKDVRPGTRAVTNLIQRKSNPEETESHAAKFSFKVDAANKKGSVMKLETTSLTVVLCLDYLLQILDFFSRSEVTESQNPKTDLSTKYEKFPTGNDPVPVREVTADMPKVTVGIEVEPEKDPFSAFFNFAETEIILVESMDTFQSNALLLHCEVSLKQQEVNGRSNMMGTIGNIILYTCKYDSDEQHQAVAEVISPMSITLVLNYSEAVGTLIDVNISDIFIRMTAGTVELLLKIFSTIGASNDDTTEKREITDYCNLWDVKKNDEMNFWFLNPDASVEVGLEALQVQEDKARLFNIAEDLKVSERLVLESGCIVLTFETGIGNNTMPMLLIETDMDLQMFDWSTNMTVAGRMKLEAAYYNATFGLWEFLIEPVETRHHGRVAHQPWEMLFEYSSRVNPGLVVNPEDEPSASSSYVSIALESSSILELTVTRTALDVIDVLRDDFQAATKKLISEKAISTAAYTIVNDTGSDVRIFIKEKNCAQNFILFRGGIDYEEVVLKTGTSVNLSLIESADMTKHHSSVLREQEGKEERLLSIQIDDYKFKKEIPVNRASKRYYSLKKPGQHGNCGMICDTWVKDCSKIVTLRGVVQIINDLQVDVDVYYKEDNGKSAKLAGTASSGQKFNLPIPCTYTRTGELFFAPEGFNISYEAFSWTTALQELEKISELKCKSGTVSNKYFFIKVMGEAKQALHESTNRKNLASQCCFIYLEPPLLLNNLLPVSIGYFSNPNEELVIAEHGTSVCVTNIRVELNGNCKLSLKVPNYNNMSWSCDVVMDNTTPEISQWTFKCENDSKIFGTLGIHREVEDNEITWHVYVPYWMINRTGLYLIYRGDDKQSHQTHHPKDHEEPILFSFPGKAFFSKKAACVKIKHIKLPSAGSDWSEKFSLDVAGSCGSVTCKSPIQQFQMGIEIQLSSWGLTKYIIFTPRFYMVNQCTFDVSVKEVERPDHLIDLKPNTCIPFWPESSVPHLIAIIETEKRKNETKPFRYDCVRHTLLQLRNKYGGIHVDIHFTETKTVITFSEFIPGQAPVLLVNNTTDCPFEISEEGLDDIFILLPRMCQYFTWKEPLGARILTWSAVGTDKRAQGSDKLFGDGFGMFIVPNEEDEEKKYYWISFLDGLQRVLLFTEDVELATYLQAARDNEVATAEYIIMLQGIGISLVDNEKLKEIMYMRIASSEITWESCKPGRKKRFKPLPVGNSKSIELAYQNYLNQKAISTNVKSNINLDSGIELDFATMKMNKPHSKNLRRVFQTGIWLHYKILPNSTQFHAKINRLQIDNQMHDNVFRVVFAPVPPPRSVSALDLPKPFAEVSIMQRINAHNYVQQYKYFKVLVQEFHVKLDINFVNALVDIFSGSSASRQENMLAKFILEYEEAHLSSKEILARQIISQGQKHFYDFLHFSPLKIHISFSMGGSAQLSNHFLNLVLASVGVTLTEIQDVIFKLSCMELQHSFISGEQLYNEVYSHYSSQAIKQLYVLVLGLDVLGNPYGLAMGVASGVEAFFYEPIQGAIQGPGEFAEGLALGVKSLLGSTVGGAAGAFSKITGTLGKGIAALTMDDEYQKKRRENMHNRGDAAEGLARSGKGLVMGFVEGVSGLVTKPIRGYKEDGIGGFFKGVGKGTIGFVARPAAGVVDFASGSFDAVKKCASTTIEVHRMRPPRCIPVDSVLQPYVKHEAEGVQLISEVEKGRFAKTDSYIAHALINPHGIYVLLLTNKRLFYLKRDELFGGWNIEWCYIWEEFACPPDLVERGLLFRLKDPPHKRLKMLRSTGSKDLNVPIYSAEVCTWLLSKIEEAMKSETGMVFTDGMEATEYHFV